MDLENQLATNLTEVVHQKSIALKSSDGFAGRQERHESCAHLSLEYVGLLGARTVEPPSEFYILRIPPGESAFSLLLKCSQRICVPVYMACEFADQSADELAAGVALASS